MATRANYVKLGLFVMIGLVVATVLAITAGIVQLRRETTPGVTYFVESVQGLEVGAPVKARGVPVGRVAEITFAPDHEMVEVKMDFDVEAMRAMGVDADRPRPDVRAQLASQGLLGMRYVALDLFDSSRYPPPPLSFAPPERYRYIPSTPSVQKSLEASAAKTLDRLAALADTVVEEGIAEKTSQALTDLDVFLRDVDHTLKQFDSEKLPTRGGKAIEDVRATMAKLNAALDGVNADGGVLATARGALSSVGAAGRNVSIASVDLQAVLEELRAAAAAIRGLAEQIEQNPDMLLKGRSKP